MKKRQPNPIERAIELAGGQSALAEKLNYTALGKARDKKYRQGHVWKWLQSGEIPAEHCPVIEQAIGIPRHELRPDVYEKAAA